MVCAAELSCPGVLPVIVSSFQRENGGTKGCPEDGTERNATNAFTEVSYSIVHDA